MSKLTWKEPKKSDYFNDETYETECGSYLITYDHGFEDYSVDAKICSDGRFGPIGDEFSTFEEAEAFLLNWIKIQEKVEEAKSSETSLKNLCSTIVIEEVEYVLYVTDEDELEVYDPTIGHQIYSIENISSQIDRKRRKENFLKKIIKESKRISEWNQLQDKIVDSYWNDQSFQAGDFEISVLKNRIEIYGVNSLYFQVIDIQSCDSAEEVSSLPKLYEFFKNYVLTQK
jgi:hypothetical protein